MIVDVNSHPANVAALPKNNYSWLNVHAGDAVPVVPSRMWVWSVFRKTMGAGIRKVRSWKLLNSMLVPRWTVQQASYLCKVYLRNLKMWGHSKRDDKAPGNTRHHISATAFLSKGHTVMKMGRLGLLEYNKLRDLVEFSALDFRNESCALRAKPIFCYDL